MTSSLQLRALQTEPSWAKAELLSTVPLNQRSTDDRGFAPSVAAIRNARRLVAQDECAIDSNRLIDSLVISGYEQYNEKMTSDERSEKRASGARRPSVP